MFVSQPATYHSFTALDRLADAQTEALEQPGNALRLHLERVPLAERPQRLRRRVPRPAQCNELGEVPLEAGGRDDLEDARRLVARVPERMPLIARLEHQVARP